MSFLVHLLRPPDEADLERLRQSLHPEVVLTVGKDLPDPAAYHILVAGRPEREHIAASPDLRALVIPWAGLPSETRKLMLEFPRIAVHNLHHNAAPVAEMVIGLMLAAAKFIVPIERVFRNGDWTPRYQPNPSVLLEGKTALILGYGAIGRRVARACQGLGMRVVALRRSGETVEDGVARVYPAHMLHDLLPRAEVLLVCLPHTDETHGLIGERELSLLPSGTVLVNVGRGPVVDEGALYRALCDGTLYAAGLDVWYNYPPDEDSRPHTPPSDYPFHELDNVVMSPHRAGGSRRTEELRVEHLADVLNAAARGEVIPNRVDLASGY